MAKAVEFGAADYVVYPTHGVGRVLGVEKQEISGHLLELIIIKFEKDRMTLRVPVGKAQASALGSVSGRIASASQLHGFTRVVKGAFTREERLELMEMLWEVAYADGELHHLEASLMRRLAGLLQVPDRDSGAARKRVLERLESSKA